MKSSQVFLSVSSDDERFPTVLCLTLRLIAVDVKMIISRKTERHPDSECELC